MTCTAISNSPRGGTVSAGEMIYIVDDDASAGEILSSLLYAHGKQVHMLASGQEFLEFLRQDAYACLILDLRMPGMNGLQVQELIAAQTAISLIFITGPGDISSTVTAIKGGMANFLTKPIDESAFCTSRDKALEQDWRLRSAAVERESQFARYQSLITREKEVLPLLVRGLLNKPSSVELGIKECTVEIHRGISCGKWKLIRSRLWLNSLQNSILSLRKHPRLHAAIFYGYYQRGGGFNGRTGPYDRDR